MGMSYFDHGRMAGLQAGQLTAMREMAERLLEEKFHSPLAAPVKQRVEVLEVAQLKELMLKLLHAQSLKELGLED